MKPELPSPNEISVTVYATNSPEPKSFTWSRTMKVKDAVAAVLVAFGYAPNTTATLQDAEALEPFDLDKPLVAVGVKDGDALEIVLTGGGV